jgi:hypothetical protein
LSWLEKAEQFNPAQVIASTVGRNFGQLILKFINNLLM